MWFGYTFAIHIIFKSPVSTYNGIIHALIKEMQVEIDFVFKL